jgi:hypothetical protein
MSTPNFYNRNASKIFASECGDRFELDDIIGNVISELKGTREVDRWDGDRNYEAKTFGEVEIEKNKWRIIIGLDIRSGYYSGVNLDWHVEAEDLTTGDVDEWEEGATFLPAYMEAIIRRKIKQIEKVYAIYTTPLICRGIFSNGEAVYEKAKK